MDFRKNLDNKNEPFPTENVEISFKKVFKKKPKKKKTTGLLQLTPLANFYRIRG